MGSLTVIVQGVDDTTTAAVCQVLHFECPPKIPHGLYQRTITGVLWNVKRAFPLIPFWWFALRLAQRDDHIKRAALTQFAF